jgi:hypothetical protein
MANKGVDGIMDLVDDSIACFNLIGEFEGSVPFQKFDECFARMTES